MIIKAFSLALILISAPPDISFHHSLSGEFSYLKDKSVSFAEYYGGITKSVGGFTSKDNNIVKTQKFKSPYLAFALTAIAIPISLGLLVNTSNNTPDNNLRFLIIPASAVLLPIPSHIYVKDSGPKTVALTLSKFAFWGVMGKGLLSGYGALACEDHANDCNAGSDALPLFVFGAIGLGGIYLYELIDAPLAANRYNEKIQQQQGFYVQPLAWKGECRVNVGYNF